jgi:F-type H+-transporting ATPase subunit b
MFMGNADPGLFVWSLITFGILLFVLSRFAFKPISRLLAEREETIRASLEEARTARDEAKAVRDENGKALAQVREEAGRIIQEGHRVVERMRHEAADGARKEAEIVMRQALADIDRETQRSLDELKTTVVGLSLRISRQVIGEELNDERHRRLAEDFVERLKASHAGPKTP